MTDIQILDKQYFEVEIYKQDITVYSIETNKLFIGQVDSDEKGVILVSLDLSKLNNSIIAHEAVHAAFYIFNNKGIGCSPDNHEHFAYLVEYIFEKLSSIVDKMRQKPRKT